MREHAQCRCSAMYVVWGTLMVFLAPKLWGFEAPPDASRSASCLVLALAQDGGTHCHKKVSTWPPPGLEDALAVVWGRCAEIATMWLERFGRERYGPCVSRQCTHPPMSSLLAQHPQAWVAWVVGVSSGQGPRRESAWRWHGSWRVLHNVFPPWISISALAACLHIDLQRGR